MGLSGPADDGMGTDEEPFSKAEACRRWGNTEKTRV